MKPRNAGYCAIVGRPNVGKSSLLNRLIGQKLAITSAKPQTTRHSIIGVKTREEGQIVYVDTPGIHQRGDQAMNRYLNQTARSVLSDVHIILFVVEALRWTAEDEAVLASIAAARSPTILVVNKVDRVKIKHKLLPFLSETAARMAFAEVFPVSATNGENIEAMERGILNLLPQGDNYFPEDQLTDRSERFFASELIREQLTRRYGKEIPYALTVEIEKFEEAAHLYRIHALIWVERAGQKNIIIGQKGAALKETAKQARIAMERLYGKKVYLEIWIKIRKSWSSDEQALINLGYSD
ncbi:MAG: GTPase Era [Gammaproteobacteria bacterium]|nr:GTPase Era [Gammaproteobacteria bacterium]MCB1878436.1 GTPase Era [Gammaproteobacteria bacterium]